MLPKSVTLRTEKNVLIWKNTSYNISVADARSVAGEILKLAQQPGIQLLLVDNRGVHGAWPAEVNPVWGELMGALAKHIQKSATIAEAIVAMQINRLSKTSGTFDQVQAFEDLPQAQAFLGVSQLAID